MSPELLEEGEDPEVAFLDRFSDSAIPVRPVSACRLEGGTRHNVVDVASGRYGLLFTVSPVVWDGPERATIEVGYFQGGLWGRGWSCHLEGGEGEWAVSDCDMTSLLVRAFQNGRVGAWFGMLATVVLMSGDPVVAQTIRGDTASVQVSGIVLDQGTARPLPEVDVSIVDTVTSVSHETRTDSRGRFEFPPLPAATYRLQTQRIGYPSGEEVFEAWPGDALEVRVELSADPLEMRPIIVISPRRSDLRLLGFHTRREAGVGVFFTRADIEEIDPISTSNLLGVLPGLRVQPWRDPSNSRLHELFPQIREEVYMVGGCRPAVLLDGIRVDDVPAFDYDGVIGVELIEAIEIYRGLGEIPSELCRRSGADTEHECGTLAIWTAPPERDLGRRSRWRTVAGVSMAIVTAIVLFR